jgi:hypothetical protein
MHDSGRAQSQFFAKLGRARVESVDFLPVCHFRDTLV